jgi:hypothetical protein
MFLKLRILKRLDISKPTSLVSLFQEFGDSTKVAIAIDELGLDKYIKAENVDEITLYTVSSFKRFKKDLFLKSLNWACVIVAAITGIISVLQP